VGMLLCQRKNKTTCEKITETQRHEERRRIKCLLCVSVVQKYDVALFMRGHITNRRNTKKPSIPQTFHLEFGCLGFFWDLEFGVWDFGFPDFPGAWILVLGSSSGRNLSLNPRRGVLRQLSCILEVQLSLNLFPI